MESKESIIRPAQPEDAPVAGRLVYYSGPNLFLYLWHKPEGDIIRVLTRLFPLPHHLFSYMYAFTAECDSRVVGLVLGYDGKTKQIADKAIARPNVRKETGFRLWDIPHLLRALRDLRKVSLPVSDNEYYINDLAVLPEMRRHGIGQQLMEFAENHARSEGLKKMSLDVVIDNEAAQQLYKRLGYMVTETLTDSGFTKRSSILGMMRMGKPIA
jgi:ribosomal protein S18 acetylase RimI-like enzyme